MKKKAVIGASLLVAALIPVSFVCAETSVQTHGSANATDSGGLGTGINSMVKNILGDTAPANATAPQTMMMQAETSVAADAAPAARTMSMKTSFSPTIAPLAPTTEEDLAAHVKALMKEDTRIQSIDRADTHVRVTYVIPMKVLRFVSVQFRVTVSAYASGETEVSYPWYSFLASRVAPDFQTRVASRVEPLIDSESFTPATQMALINEIQATLHQEFALRR